MGSGVTLQIDNSRYARSTVLFGRWVPIIVGGLAAWTFIASLGTGNFPTMLLGGMITVLWIVYMVIAYLRRGRQSVVMRVQFDGEQFEVTFLHSTERFEVLQIRCMEYEGIGNPSRAPVATAPFARDGERILVMTLGSGLELRVRVQHEHDAPLKKIAARIAEQAR